MALGRARRRWRGWPGGAAIGAGVLLHDAQPTQLVLARGSVPRSTTKRHSPRIADSTALRHGGAAGRRRPRCTTGPATSAWGFVCGGITSTRISAFGSPTTNRLSVAKWDSREKEFVGRVPLRRAPSPSSSCRPAASTITIENPGIGTAWRWASSSTSLTRRREVFRESMMICRRGGARIPTPKRDCRPCPRRWRQREPCPS